MRATPTRSPWLDATPRERSEMLLKLADVIDENADELAALESRNVKPIAAARDEPGEMADNLASSQAPRASSKVGRPASTCRERLLDSP